VFLSVEAWMDKKRTINQLSSDQWPVVGSVASKWLELTREQSKNGAD
jgi:hypothetical protein